MPGGKKPDWNLEDLPRLMEEARRSTIQPHSNHPKLRRELQADALRRAREDIAADPELSADPAMCLDDFDAYRPILEFASPVWTGKAEVPEWASVEVQDGQWIFSVTYDWIENTVTVECT